MSGNKYIIDDDLEDVDDDLFLKNSQNNSTSSTNPFAQDLQNQKQSYEQKRQEIEQRTLQSSYRSMGLLRETEQVGSATAEELARQREQLEKTSQQLDDINTNLRYSQKHLNGLKSMFGSLKNYLAGKNEITPRMTSSPSGSKISSSNTDNVNRLSSPNQSNRMSPDELYDNHPVTRLRSDQQEHQMVKTTTATSFSQQLDRNLDEMVGSLSKLKGLAMDLGQEIESQNDLIDDIHDKVENTDMKIIKQNREMNKMLGKK